MSSSRPQLSVVIPTTRPSIHLKRLTQGILREAERLELPVEVIVVEDGVDPSDQATPHPTAALRLVSLSPRKGRALARNAGASLARGTILIFLDADCRPEPPDWMQQILDAFGDDAICALGGRVIGGGGNFWTRYQREVNARRARKHGSLTPGLTSAFLAVRKDVFDHCGGFDARYAGYGFEDRDLLLRLARRGALKFQEGVFVIHEDQLRLADVASKLEEAGRLTASVFHEDHAASYRALGYAALDCGLHPYLSPIAAVGGPLALAAATRLDPWLDRLPYLVSKSMVKLISAVAFLYGTSRRSSAA